MSVIKSRIILYIFSMEIIGLGCVIPLFMLKSIRIVRGDEVTKI